MLALGRNILERAFSWPLTARDRILRAHSRDGLTWTRDESFVFSPFYWDKVPMAYYAARDERGRLWLRVSVIGDDGAWKTCLFEGDQKIGLETAGLRHLFGPSWSGNRLYGVGQRMNESDRWFVCLQRGGAGFRLLAQNWERPDLVDVEDVSIVRSADGTWHAYATCRRSDALTNIGHWTSMDGIRWGYSGIVLQSPLTRGLVSLASNPCVVATSDQDWRLYYRAGEMPAVGNHIRSARSRDLESWAFEDGIRLSASKESPWERHGVAFPFVHPDGEGGWTMYYTGFWGAGAAARITAERWSEYSSRPA